MSGWNQIRQIRKLEERADLLGMKFAPYQHNDYNEDNVSLIPKDRDALPIYTRDAILFAGSLEGADQWMQGVVWAREYDRMMIDKNNDKKREKKESIECQRQLMKTIKDGKLAQGVVE